MQMSKQKTAMSPMSHSHFLNNRYPVRPYLKTFLFILIPAMIPHAATAITTYSVIGVVSPVFAPVIVVVPGFVVVVGVVVVGFTVVEGFVTGVGVGVGFCVPSGVTTSSVLFNVTFSNSTTRSKIAALQVTVNSFFAST